ncbi:MAG: adenosylcobinamide-GDP ribazoletransferase [Syntrophales bacterium]|nr:adenosylcobinamide-GDP ribazoletransferase [Syntrophales bacterium]
MIKFLTALQFLTIIRITRKLDITEEKLGGSMACFPLVGLLLGLILVAVRYAFGYILPASIVDILVIAVLVIITGALHLDGFADTVDGLTGGKDREKTLAIMRDSRIGSFAVAGLVLFLMLKIFALLEAPPEIKNRILLLMPVLGRWSTVQLAFGFTYARSGPGTGLAFTRFAGKREYVIATLITAVISLGLFQLKGLLILLVIAVLTLLFGLFFQRRLGGVTGDIIGAACEINEVATLLMIGVISTRNPDFWRLYF